MKYKKYKKFFAIFTFAFAIFQFAAADIYFSEKYGYYMDLPEAYNLMDMTQDEQSMYFAHSVLPVHFVLQIYEGQTNSEKTLQTALKKLNSTSETVKLEWCGEKCAVGQIQFSLGNATNLGYAASIPIAQGKAIAILLCYSDSQNAKNVTPFIVSTVDSFMIDKQGFFCPGILTTFAFPKNEQKEIRFNVNCGEATTKTIKTSISAEDKEAASFVVEREYAVVSTFSTHRLGKEAFWRYYRMIFRDSYSRLKTVAADMYKQLFVEAVKKDPKNPEKAYIQILLNWVQNFEYSRHHEGSDFTDLISAICGEGNDCDSRSLLLCILARHVGINSAFFVSIEYSHAVAGFDLEGKGARLKGGETEFLLGETTAKNLDLGLMRQDLTDSSKWHYVDLP